MAEPTVTALIVTPGETPFLNRTLKGLREQSRTPNRTVLINVGDDVPKNVDDIEVISVGNAKNFGDAIRRACKVQPSILDSDWLWTLHDDSAPFPGCLEALVQTGEDGLTIGIVGPKQIAWSNPDRLLEVGIKASRAGRRLDYLLPGEIDQGQHDNTSDVLGVGTAGMLIRSELWEATDGPDPALGPFGEGLELSRRVRLMGHRAAIAPAAKVAHARASFRDVRDKEEPDINRSFSERRAAQLYNTMLANPTPLFVLMLLTLPFLTIGRVLMRLIAKQPDLAIAEFTGMARAYVHVPDAIRGRSRIKKQQVVPASTLHSLEETNRDITRAKRTISKREREAKPVETIEPVAARLLRAHRAKSWGAGGLGVALVAIMTVFVSNSLTGGITGGAWVSLPDSFAELWHQAWSGWVVGGAGAPGPGDPLLMVWAVVTAPFALFGVSPHWVLNAFWIVAPVLAWVFMYVAATTLTHRVQWRFAFATVWLAMPTFLVSWTQGRLAGVIVHVALPLLLLGWMRTVHRARPLRIRGAGDAELVLEDRTFRSSFAALAAAMAVVVVAAAPWTGLAFILMGVLLVASRPKRWKIVLLTLVPATVMMLPTWIAAVQLPGTRTLRLLLAESGQPMGFSVAPTWQTVVGLPQDLSTFPVLWNENLDVVWMFPGALVALGATLALLKVSGDWMRTRVFYVIAVAAFVIAIVSSRTAISFEDALIGAWPGVALSIAALSLMVAWAGLIRPLVLEEKIRSTRAQKRLEERRRKRLAEQGVEEPPSANITDRIVRPLASIGLAASIVLPIAPLVMWVPHANAVNFADQTGEVAENLIGPAPSYQTPAAVQEAQKYPRHARFLVLQVDEDGVRAALYRGNGHELGDSAPRLRLERAVDVQYSQVDGNFDVLASTDPANAAFAELVGKLLTSPEQTDGLANFAIDQVALSFGSSTERAAAQTALDQNPSLERAGEADVGALWRARPDGVVPSRAYIDDQGTLTTVPSGLVGGSFNLEDYEFEPGSVLVLSERADENWRATIDAETLEPVEYGWQQAFKLEDTTGTVKIAWHNDWMPLWWVGSAISIAGIVIGAIPVRRRIRHDDA